MYREGPVCVCVLQLVLSHDSAHGDSGNVSTLDDITLANKDQHGSVHRPELVHPAAATSSSFDLFPVRSPLRAARICGLTTSQLGLEALYHRDWL